MRVLVRDRPPRAVHVVELVAVPVRMGPPLAAVATVGLELVAEVGQRGILGEAVRDVDPEPVDASVEPEPEDRFELGADLGVRPVEVRLLSGEQVEVPLAIGDAVPGRTAEDRAPVVGRLLAALAATRPEQVARSGRAPGR
jgi:hypothetical protein